MNSPQTIIVVDDEPDTAEMIAEMLRLSGYQALKSYAGAPAVSLIATHRPAAIVLDLMMPEFSGMDVLRFVRNDPQLKQVPVIVVSAKTLPADIDAALRTGASVYLTKPVSFLELKAAVEAVLGRGEKSP